ncbi:MAG: DUF992 domain-containing protein, partial [Rhodospirillales bacterium]|nr:DUF992 domain-containing protein [Rhodospirillales bacterium]
MRKTTLALALMLAVAAASAALAADPGVKLGVLRCEQVPGSGINLLIHSTVNVRCQFTSVTGGTPARYQGETGIGLGIDLNWDKTETIAFTVFGATANVAGSHPLAGTYVGGRASAAAGVGAGVQALVGGGSNHFTLQP